MVRNLLMTAAACGAFCGLLSVGFAQNPPAANPPAATTSTNTNSNQKQADRDLTAKIRKSIVDDKSLSTAAHNVTIKTENGHVTLRGKVNSEDEKTTVEGKAKEIAGDSNVASELTVSASKKKTG
jgi:hyperosmotically inducible protein